MEHSTFFHLLKHTALISQMFYLHVSVIILAEMSGFSLWENLTKNVGELPSSPLLEEGRKMPGRN